MWIQVRHLLQTRLLNHMQKNGLTHNKLDRVITTTHLCSMVIVLEELSNSSPLLQGSFTISLHPPLCKKLAHVGLTV